MKHYFTNKQLTGKFQVKFLNLILCRFTARQEWTLRHLRRSVDFSYLQLTLLALMSRNQIKASVTIIKIYSVRKRKIVPFMENLKNCAHFPIDKLVFQSVIDFFRRFSLENLFTLVRLIMTGKNNGG